VEPQPAAATRILVTGGPAALSFVEAQDQLFVADLSGLIWSLQHGLAALTRPFPVPGEPVAVAADLTNQRLYVTVRSQPAVVVLDARTGIQIASTSLPAQPGDAQLDSSLGVLYVVLPARNALELIDVHDLKTVRITPDLPGITDIAIDQETHTVYLSHLDGRISVIDGRSGQVRSQLSLSGPGLSGVATADGRVFAINQPAREVLEVDLSASDVSRFPLAAEPVSIVVGPQSGLVYVLDAITNTLVKLDSNDGSEVGRVSVGDEGAVRMSSLQPDTLWLRPRVVASASDERIFVIEPQSAALAVVPPGP
jgi:DNA-binding beta-propeller fold protein YncE